MRRFVFGAACVFALAVTPLFGQTANPLVAAFRQDLTRKFSNLAAGAQIMPANKYGYQPTPAEYTFGGMVLHVAGSAGMMCSRASGAAAPSLAGLTPNSPKAKLVAAMRAAFDFCNDQLAKLTDADLTQSVPMFGGRMMPKIGVLVTLVDDMGDHYSQESIYLRINGHLPPTAMGRGGMMRGGRRGGRGGRMGGMSPMGGGM